MTDKAGTPPTGTEQDERVDAIRYVVLGKLAPGLRHALMGELQAIQLSAELATRSIHAGGDLAELRDSVDRIPQLCSSAVKVGRWLTDWLRPDLEATTSVGEGVDQCLKLAGEDWFLRGIEATTDVPGRDVQVPKAALQELVVTAILVLTDMHQRPLDLHIAVRPAKDWVEIALRANIAERVASLPTLTSPYRSLTWADLGRLASAYGVACMGEGAVASLQLKRVAVSPQGG